MRGSNLLFTDIFPIPATERNRRGRSETADRERNECLIYRYHFVGIHTGFRYEFLLKIIAKEFWLSETTVHNVISLNRHILIQAKKENAARNELRKRWPQLSWEVPTLAQYNLIQIQAVAC
jgi:hypothetical protein